MCVCLCVCAHSRVCVCMYVCIQFIEFFKIRNFFTFSGKETVTFFVNILEEIFLNEILLIFLYILNMYFFIFVECCA